MSSKLPIKFREATKNDLKSIVNLLHQDELGSTREQVNDLSHYEKAFSEIDVDPNQMILVADWDGKVAGTLQLTFIRHLTFQGGLRAQIEGVRTDPLLRNQNIGSSLIDHAILLAKKRGCHLVQLTSNKKRPRALRFYEKCGFESTHEGFKLYLS